MALASHDIVRGTRDRLTRLTVAINNNEHGRYERLITAVVRLLILFTVNTLAINLECLARVQESCETWKPKKLSEWDLLNVFLIN